MDKISKMVLALCKNKILQNECFVENNMIELPDMRKGMGDFAQTVITLIEELEVLKVKDDDSISKEYVDSVNPGNANIRIVPVPIKYEYDVKSCIFNNVEQYLDYLNNLGNEGWEFCGAKAFDNEFYKYGGDNFSIINGIFKRVKNN